MQTLDGTCKMVLVDDSENVWQIVEAIGQKVPPAFLRCSIRVARDPCTDCAS